MIITSCFIRLYGLLRKKTVIFFGEEMAKGA